MSNTEKTPHAAMPDELQQLKEFWEAHGQRILTIICIVLAAVLAKNLYTRWSVGEKVSVTADYKMDAGQEQLETYIADHGRSVPGKLAKIRLAKAQFDNARYDEALNTYDAFLARHATGALSDFSAIAELGRANCLEAKKDYAAAKPIFEKYAAVEAKSDLRSIAVMGLARCQSLTGDLEAAETTLSAFMDEEDVDDYWKGRCERLIELLKRHANAPEDAFTPPAISDPAPLVEPAAAATPAPAPAATNTPASGE